MNQAQRRLLADKLCNLGNFAATALIFTQLISEKGPKYGLTLLGGLFWTLCHAVAVRLLREGKDVQ